MSNFHKISSFKTEEDFCWTFKWSSVILGYVVIKNINLKSNSDFSSLQSDRIGII